MKATICTLAHGRHDHLTNLVRGLNHSRRPPLELVIGVMQDNAYELPQTGFPTRQVLLGKRDPICLAAARNAAAEKAQGDLLIFLDVDCIPAPGLIDDYIAAAKTHDGVFMGEVGYLPKGATDGGLNFDRFEQAAVLHSERAGPPRGQVGACLDYRCFWSLNFALTAERFLDLGGFDTRYVGYGGEDTDFGRKIAEQEMPLWWVRGAKAFHQYHAHHMPPVHHLDSVLRNSEVFAAKWGQPTMQHWLRSFRLMGLIDRDANGEWVKLRAPNEADFELTRQQEDQPFASSASVLEYLERRAASAEAAAEPEIAV